MQLGHNVASISGVSRGFLGNASKSLGAGKKKIFGAVRRGLGTAFATQNEGKFGHALYPGV